MYERFIAILRVLVARLHSVMRWKTLNNLMQIDKGNALLERGSLSLVFILGYLGLWVKYVEYFSFTFYEKWDS